MYVKGGFAGASTRQVGMGRILATSKKVALVTGANKGIGLRVAQELATLGMQVWLGARDKERGQAAAQTLRSQGLDVRFIKLDVTRPNDAISVAKAIDKRSGRLDVLINNAGVAIDNALASALAPDVLRKTFDTNFFGIVSVTQAALPLLRKSDAGRIVNVSSGLGSLTLQSDPDYEFNHLKLLAYASSKAALNMSTIAFAYDLRDTPIKVNVADPGFTATDINQHRGYRSVDQAAQLIARLATLPADGPSGGFFDEAGVVPW